MHWSASYLLVAAGLSAVVSYVLLVICYGCAKRWQFRHWPGPPANLFTGNLLACANKDLYLVAHSWAQQYGKAFLVWFGQRPQLWISDFDMMYEIGVKRFANFYNRAFLVAFALPPKALASLHKEVLLAKQPLWGSLRAALQPLFHNSSLLRYSPHINAAAVQLREYFEAFANPEGQMQGISCEVRYPLAALSLDVVGMAAMGCNMGALDSLLLSATHLLDIPPPSAAHPTDASVPDATNPDHGRQLAGIDHSMHMPAQSSTPDRQHDDLSGNALAAERLAEQVPIPSAGSKSLSAHAAAVPAEVDGQEQYSLLQAAEDVFSNATMGGAGTLMQLLGPPGFLQGFWIWLVLRVFKSPAAVGSLRGRTRLFAACRCLYHNALRRLAAEGERVPDPDDSWVWWTPQEEKGNPCTHLVPVEGSLADMLSRASSKQRDGGLSELEVVTNIYEMLAAGSESTANTLAYSLYLLARNKHVEEKLLQEVDAHGPDWAPSYEEVCKLPYLDAVLMEAMRVLPVAPMTNRASACDVVIGDLRIPRDTSIVFDIYSLGRDTSLFPDPDVFRPERWLDADPRLKALTSMSFGLGPRNCIGQRLALGEMKIALVRLYQRLTFDVDMTHHGGGLKTKQNLTVQPIHGVHLFPRKRACSA